MDKTVKEILTTIPRNITAVEIEAWFIILTLERNNGNMTRTSREMGLNIKTLKNRMHHAKTRGYPINPKIKIGRPKLSE
jgi:DNA-binding NtrC family response regulator